MPSCASCALANGFVQRTRESVDGLVRLGSTAFAIILISLVYPGFGFVTSIVHHRQCVRGLGSYLFTGSLQTLLYTRFHPTIAEAIHAVGGVYGMTWSCDLRTRPRVMTVEGFPAHMQDPFNLLPSHPIMQRLTGHWVPLHSPRPLDQSPVRLPPSHRIHHHTFLAPFVFASHHLFATRRQAAYYDPESMGRRLCPHSRLAPSMVSVLPSSFAGRSQQ
jgi:hypothetical protein